ncbi:hypothetical protein BX616_000851, partial [Lobosporangium transversale]
MKSKHDRTDIKGFNSSDSNDPQKGRKRSTSDLQTSSSKNEAGMEFVVGHASRQQVHVVRSGRDVILAISLEREPHSSNLHFQVQNTILTPWEMTQEI